MGQADGQGGQPGGGGSQAPVTILWFGHAAFLITSPGGVRVLTDPYPGNLGYGNRRFAADVVTVSHEHFDHNSVASVDGDPLVLRALEGDDWVERDETVEDVRIIIIGGTYHDESQGSKRGKNGLVLIEAGGLRILHLGDLGAEPSQDVIQRLGRVDVLLIPVGGFFTIDAAAAARVVETIGPRVTIPMHFRTSAISSWGISDEEPFLRGRSGVRRLESHQVTLSPATLPAAPETWVLRPGP